MRVGLYARVSTDDQTTENQLIELRRFAKDRGWEADEFVDKGLSGSLEKEKRPELNRLMEAAHRGKIKIVIVWRFDRFARSMKQLIDALDEFRDWGVNFISLTENIDTTTSHGRMLFGIFAAFSEFERSLIRERTKAGLVRARAQGKTLGRPQIDKKVGQVIMLRAGGMSLRGIERQIGISRQTVARVLSQNRMQNSVGERA